MNKTFSNKARGICLALVIAALAALPACSVLDQPDPMPLVTLRTPVPQLALCEEPMPAQIVVGMPDAGHGLRTDRIALLFDEREIKYLAGYKWDMPAPAMLQRQFIRYLNATGCFSGVGAEASGISTRYRLQSDVQRLHFLYAGADKIPTAEIALRLTLLNADEGRVIGSKDIRFVEKAEGDDLDSLLNAMDNVAYRAMLDTARWTASMVGEQSGKQEKKVRN